jgi:hypothetical protein
MKFTSKLLVVLCLIAGIVYCRIPELPSTIDDESFLGNWAALSKNHRSISGDMTVTPDSILFAKKGDVSYQVLKFDGKEYILKIDRDVDYGFFMRLGPIDSTSIEVAFFQTVEEALAKRKDSIGEASSWGIYHR